MNFETDSEALAATFNELTHLLVHPHRLTLENAELGVGGFGVVGLATLDKSSTFPRKVAVKQLQIMETSIVRQRIAFRLARELKVWAKIKHPNILELIGYYLSDNHGCAQFVSAYMANGNVMQYIQRTRASLAVRLKFVQDIAAGLKYLHDFSPPICHGDLKPANVLVKEGIDAVLCDFGVSSFIQESGAASGLTTSKSIKGSARYMGPELFPEEGNPKHTLQSDVWAWGCTVFEVMTESIPYPSKSTDVGVVIEMQKKSIPGSIEMLGDLLVGTNVDPISQTGVTSLQWVILQCWDFDPMERPSSASILRDVSIPFKAKTRLGDWEDGEAGISSLRIEDDFDYVGSTSQRSVSSYQSLEISLCANCQQHPTVEGREFCSRACLDDAASKRQPVGAVIPSFGTRAANQYDEYYDRNYRGDSGSGGSPSQGAVSPNRTSSLCINCQQHPKVKGRDFCSKACLDDASSRLTASAHQAQGQAPILIGVDKKDGNPSPLTLITPDKNNYVSIARRVQERWDDPLLAPPEIAAIYQINLSKKYEARFRDAVSAADRLGGCTTKTAFYGGQCICDLGVPQLGSDQLCSWGSCSICIVIRNCFDVLEFNTPHYTGDLGNGIYANLNPARAHRFTVGKPKYPSRTIILCSIIQLDDFVRGDKKKYSAFIENTGRVFCVNKDVILPRQLIIYKDPEPKAMSVDKTDRNPSPLTLITPDKNNYVSIARRVQERWDDPLLAPPEVVAIYQINLSKKYEARFRDAVSAADRLGGCTTKTAFYGGQCICDLGVPQFGSDQLCSWGSCSICIVIRNCFDVLEFNTPHYTGDLGKGIYANLNPARAHRFTVSKPKYPSRTIILCSIIQLDDFVRGDKKKYSAFIEDTGRVFCANKDVILPRQLILYKDPKPKAILR